MESAHDVSMPGQNNSRTQALCRRVPSTFKKAGYPRRESILLRRSTWRWESPVVTELSALSR